MSANIDAIVIQEERKSLDKKEIEVEEREKMLNEENKPIEEVLVKTDSETVEAVKPIIEPMTEEGREVKPKFIPIGGIKMPGFFTRSKSKEKCKDGDDGAQGELLEKPTEESKENVEEKDANVQKKCRFNFKIPNPFAKSNAEDAEKQTDPQTQTGQKKGLLNAIRLPLANMIPKKLRRHDGPTDAESGLDGGKQAELASMETLDDNKDTVDKDVKTDDGMETVKLDVEEKTEGEDEKEKEKEKLDLRGRIRQQKFIIDDLAVVGGILIFILLLIIIIIVAASGDAFPVESPIKDGQYVDAVTSCGYVEGKLEDGAIAYRGIPYSLPPTENNRFNFAQPLNKVEYCWNDTFKAHNATPPCIQIYGNGTIDGVEDCLTLDVITPKVRYDNPLPVVVLIGSNSLIGGTPGKLRPSATFARAKEVVFVRPNFRVGALGFLATESLSKSVYPRRSGNYGLSDILAALMWVQINIKHFGGNNTAVTLFGHRAGATLVTSLLSHKKAKDLFSKVWISSGSAVLPSKESEETEKANDVYMDLIKCKDNDCLKTANVDDLVNLIPDTWRSASPDLPQKDEVPDKRHEWLVLDRTIITKSISNDTLDSKIPMVIGTTAHESSSTKLLEKHTVWTPELVRKHVEESVIGSLGLVDEVFERYNATYQGLAAMISDIRTVCPLLNFSRRQNGVPFYIVTQVRGEHNITDVDSDILAILGRYEPKTPEQRRYISAMQQFFYHYVSHGEVSQMKPNKSTILEVGQDVLPMARHENCDFWISKDIVPKYARLD